MLAQALQRVSNDSSGFQPARAVATRIPPLSSGCGEDCTTARRGGLEARCYDPKRAEARFGCSDAGSFGGNGAKIQVLTPWLRRGVLVNAHDITERTQAEAVHQASEAWFRAIFSSAPVGIVAANREGQMVDVNPSLAALFGCAPAELIGQPITRLLPNEHPTSVNLQLIGRHRDGTPLPVEVR